MSIVTPQERAEIAKASGVDDQWLYQCLTGRKEMAGPTALVVESVSGQRIRAWHLRQRSWWKHWPHLIGAEGAPAVVQSPSKA